MSWTRIEDIQAPQLEPYRHLRTTNLTRFSGRFIAESKPLVARLLASQLQVESVLLDEAFVEEAQGWIPADQSVWVVPSAMISELIGFHFHRGYLACGLRPAMGTMDDLLQKQAWGGATSQRDRWTGVLLVGVQDPENLGSILRTCSAFGIQDIVLGPQCVDPFARRVLRVSMGNAFKLRFFEVDDVHHALRAFEQKGIESIAACLADDSEELCEFARHGHSVVLFGNEAHGLPDDILTGCSRRLKIEMGLATDSLNVSVAAGIILHNLCRIC
ncbi:tRNA (guanosine(18)-2'-O)-methyltransferase [Pirellula sp. SH-Sr6A]|uniref:TrmH family RNA methyltransferase n=1 Tax=Pirellula sp. SH-Sr6A TaxID=1632865 RepID=UPI00078D6B19|nr:RNA methyltransferase [Pirellula sp. SH-Sr6A]AMV32309.1 tRNA (guanosine(18)-2'-O)-methyltransferase [Pirellula sp. SH-Sr6A]